MLSRQALEEIRRLSADEKWRAMFDAIEAAWRHLASLPPEEQERRISHLRKRHETSNRLMMERIRRLG